MKIKNIIVFTILIFSVFSCGDAIKKPDNLLPEDQMSELIADFAINEQGYTINPTLDGENATRYILKKYNIKGSLFTESYQYYMSKPETLKSILEDAQDIIKNKDPKAADYIEKKLKQNPEMPPQAR